MTDPTRPCSQPLLDLTDELCRIPSWWRPSDRPGAVPRHNEMDLAERVAAELSRCPWLDVSIVEAAPGTPGFGKIFERMCQLGKRGKTHRCCHALEGMRRTEHRIEVCTSVGGR